MTWTRSPESSNRFAARSSSAVPSSILPSRNVAIARLSRMRAAPFASPSCWYNARASAARDSARSARSRFMSSTEAISRACGPRGRIRRRPRRAPVRPVPPLGPGRRRRTRATRGGRASCARTGPRGWIRSAWCRSSRAPAMSPSRPRASARISSSAPRSAAAGATCRPASASVSRLAVGEGIQRAAPTPRGRTHRRAGYRPRRASAGPVRSVRRLRPAPRRGPRRAARAVDRDPRGTGPRPGRR